MFAPAASVNNVMLGYALGDFPTNGSMSPYSAYTSTGRRIRGRFLFDGRQILVLFFDFAPGMYGMFTCTWPNDSRMRRRILFTIPAAQYSFLNLPQQVISTLTFNERRRSSCTLPNFEHPVTSQNPSLCFDVHSMLRKLRGCFTDSSATRDVYNIHSGELATRSSGFLYAEMFIGNQTSESPLLRLDFFNLYSKQRGIERLLNRSFASDIRGPPLCSCAQCDLEDRAMTETLFNETQVGTQCFTRERLGTGGNEVEEILSEMLSSARAVGDQHVHRPPVRSLHHDMQPGSMQLDRLRERTARIAQQLRAQKLEQRRRRNRVSAAKSNMKKKLRVERQERELEELKKRRMDLLAVRERLQQENETLRKSFASI